MDQLSCLQQMSLLHGAADHAGVAPLHQRGPHLHNATEGIDIVVTKEHCDCMQHALLGVLKTGGIVATWSNHCDWYQTRHREPFQSSTNTISRTYHHQIPAPLPCTKNHSLTNLRGSRNAHKPHSLCSPNILSHLLAAAVRHPRSTSHSFQFSHS